MGILSFLKLRRQGSKEMIMELLEGYELPSFPAAVMKVLEMLRDPDAALSDIARQVESDPGMHVKALKFVNSAAFGLARKVSNVHHAVTLLGRARLESLILPLAVKECMPSDNLICLDAKTFWTTNAKRACLARAIARRLHPATQLEAFTAGLLQDMAIPVLINAKKDDYCVALETWNSDPESDLAQIEKAAFGFDHQTVGGLMAEEWNFPGYLQEAIGQHHISGDADKFDIDRAIIAVSSLRYPSGEHQERDDEMLKEMLRDVLAVGDQAASEIIAQAEADARQVAAIFH